MTYRTQDTKQVKGLDCSTRISGAGTTIGVMGDGREREYDFETLRLMGNGVGIFEDYTAASFENAAKEYRQSLAA